jgi:hypothetical protein
VTLVYGESGVGKSSLLQAAVRPGLDELARDRRASGKPAGFASTIFRHWSTNLVAGLATALHGEVLATIEQDRGAVESGPRDGTAWAVGRDPGALGPPLAPGDARLHVLARTWAAHVGRLLIVLDQFEDYFVSDSAADARDEFPFQLAELVNDEAAHAHVMISLRADALAELDRFKGLIPGLFRNYLRIEALDHKRGREAIEAPLKTYGKWIGQDLDVEDEVVQAVLNAVTKARPESDDDGKNSYIEASLLQLVMQRLWIAERGVSSALRFSTLQDLGGAARVIDRYVDEIIDELEPAGRRLADRICDQLVTKSGFRTALPAVDLGGEAPGTQDAVESVLRRLSSDDVRLLHRFPRPDKPKQHLYEVSHDKLAEAIVKRRERLRREAAERTRRRLTAPLTVTFALATLATVVAATAYGARSVNWTSVLVYSAPPAVLLWLATLVLWLRTRKSRQPRG